MENWTQYGKDVHELFAAFKNFLPDVGKAYEALPQETYKDGAISGKMKRLMAMTAALTHGCEACMIYQANHAMELGATAEEVLEAAAVAVSLGGTMGAAETAKIVAFLKEKGLME